MIPVPTTKPTNDVNLDLAGALWTPGDDTAPEVISKEQLADVDFDKDATRQTVQVADRHSNLIEVLKDLSGIIKDVENVEQKTEDADIITACENAEKRGFKAFVSLGRMVVEVAKETPFTNPLAIEMGDIWDRKDYAYLVDANLSDLRANLQKILSKAYEAIDGLEDKWNDAKTAVARDINAKLIHDWVGEYTVQLTAATREIHALVNAKRKILEEKQERPKYDSLGAALKAGDGPEFAKMLKTQTFEKDVLNKLMAHAVKNSVIEAIVSLSEVGADVNMLDEAGFTLFMQSILNGNVESARTLKSCGALMNQKGLNGQTDIVIAAKAGQLDSLKYLIEELSIDKDDMDVGINASCWRGFTALVHAVSEGENEAVVYLLANGADPTHQVTMDGFATPDQYTEDPEVEKILASAVQEWENKSSQKPKM